jgi:hypothetical protein
MRETSFIHPLGGMIDLPLLVPSFSSKGFDFFTEGSSKSKKTFSAATNALEDFGRYLTETYLLSAYDLHHNHFRRPDRFFHKTGLIFLDSGGYELNPEFDSSEPKITPTRELSFVRNDYIGTLDTLCKKHKDNPFVIANFDWETKNHSFEHQIRDARAIFSKHPYWASNFILKPHTTYGSVIEPDDVVPIIEELRGINVIGITEKELGKSLIDRLKRLAKLRLELNRRNIKAPIHVWGGLDPLITPLYFFAGADIFDGVSWLRYTYHDGVAVNRESYPVLVESLTLTNDQSIAFAINDNLRALQGLATSLRAFASSNIQSFDVFDSKSKFLEKAYRTMRTKIPEIGELL